MINVVKQGDFVYFSENSREEGTELLFSVENLSLEDLYKIFRPWECLWRRDHSYKLSLIDKFPELIQEASEIPDLVSIQEGDLQKEEEKFLDLLGILVTLGTIDEFQGRSMNIRYVPKYTVDIFTYLEDKYGSYLKGIYEILCLLPKDCINFLRVLSTKKFKLKYIQENYSSIDLENIIDFLPVNLKESIRLFGIYGDSMKRKSSLEFTKSGNLEAPEYPSLREEIRKEFKLGEVWVSGDSSIKSRLSEVYQRCGITDTPKIKDLFEFFDIVPTWVGSQRAYRLNYRL